MFLTDKIARKDFCVGGLFYPINFSCKFHKNRLKALQKSKSCLLQLHENTEDTKFYLRQDKNNNKI